MHTDKEKAEAWFEGTNTVMTYTDDMIDGWNKEIDIYLVFVSAYTSSLRYPHIFFVHRLPCSLRSS